MRRRSPTAWPALAAALALCVGAPASASAEVRTVTFRQGPVTLNPYQVNFTDRRDREVRAPGVDGHVVWMHARVVDARGNRIPVKRVMLHHVVYQRVRRAGEPGYKTVCENERLENFYGTGEENQALDLPSGYGLPVRAADRWEAGWMLMNHRNKRDTAYVEYEARVVTGEDLKDVTPYWLRTTGCRKTYDPVYNVRGGGEPGSLHSRPMAWNVPENGYVVATGGHAHGGSRGLDLTQPRCGNRTLMRSRPLYGMPDHPYYNVLPVLHEPGPIDMSWMRTGRGIPVVGGEQLHMVSHYDNELPHMKVMGIMHVYVHHSRDVPADCADLPPDIEELRKDEPAREDPPAFTVPLTGRDENGNARTISRPRGRWHERDGDTLVEVGSRTFNLRNISLPLGAEVRWRFTARAWHDVSLANGPVGFASRYSRRGESYRHRFDKPGTYRIFCSLHPLDMTQVVRVRDRR